MNEEGVTPRYCDCAGFHTGKCHEREVMRLQYENQHLRDLLAVAYQLAGVVGAPVRFLNAFAYHTGTVETLLPVTIDELDLPR
jgi:hypothetical protein